MKSLSLLLTTLLTTTTTTLAIPTGADPHPVCATCNPVSGENNCDITTSCINTGTRFHCACRAGYKASAHNNDVSQQFRLPMPDYEFLVFTPENTVCNTLCDNPHGMSNELCAEVQIHGECAF